MKSAVLAKITDIRRIKIGKRLSVGFLLIICLPIMIICISTFVMSSTSAKKLSSDFSEDTMAIAADGISSMIIGIDNNSIDIAYSDLLQNTLMNYDAMTPHELEMRQKELGPICVTKFIYNSAVTDVIALTNKNQIVFCLGDTTFWMRPSAASIGHILDKLRVSQSGSAYIPAGANFEQRLYDCINYQREDGFVLARTISSKNKNIGTLLIKVTDSSLRKKYAGLRLGNNSKIYIVNSDFRIISSNDSAYPVGSSCSGLGLKDKTFSAKTGRLDMSMGHDKYLGIYSHIDSTDWVILGLMPYDYINHDSWILGVYILSVGVLCMLLASILARAIANSITRPLRKLDRAMNTVVEGGDRLSADISDSAPDELGALSRRFVWMADELSGKILQIKENEKQKREAEIKVLQYQVNPHFISNTLNTIAYLAKIQGVENIEHVSNALINLMLASSGKARSLIHVKTEISYLKDYFYIQQYRFGNDVKIEFSIEEDILEYLVPCFILQPLVENSLIHGFGSMEQGGKIEITGKCEAGKLRFEVTDNGAGFDKNSLGVIFNQKANRESERLSGIGIANVNERIQLLFGREYGLSIESVPYSATTVTILLPVLKEGENHETNSSG